jgi:hypothetical protein
MLTKYGSSQDWRYVNEAKDLNSQRVQGSHVGMSSESTEKQVNRSQRTKLRFYVDIL